MCLSFDPRIGSNRHEFKTPLFAFLRVQCVNIDPRMFHALSRLGSVSVGIHIQDYAAGGSLLSSQERSGRAECLHRYPSALSRFSTASRTEKSSSTTQTGGLILFIRFSFAVWLPTTDQGSGIHSSDGSPSTPVSSHFHYAFK